MHICSSKPSSQKLDRCFANVKKKRVCLVVNECIWSFFSLVFFFHHCYYMQHSTHVWSLHPAFERRQPARCDTGESLPGHHLCLGGLALHAHYHVTPLTSTHCPQQSCGRARRTEILSARPLMFISRGHLVSALCAGRLSLSHRPHPSKSFACHFQRWPPGAFRCKVAMALA